MSWMPGMTLEHCEQVAIEAAFRWHQSNKTHTAEALKISIRTLDAKLEKYDAEREDYKRRTNDSERLRQEWLHKSRFGHQEAAGVFSATTGMHLEPASQASAQQAMPLPERIEVQEVLPKQTSAGHSKRNR